MRNRIAVSPMCQYSAHDGVANEWHFVHYGSRAVGGAGLVILEATAVEPRGRISPHDVGLWDDGQAAPLERIVDFVHEHGGAAGIQLAHAGRKAGTARPWEGGTPLPRNEGGWDVVGPSPIPFRPNFPVPHALSEKELDDIVQAFRQATVRAREARFDVVELHAAHGYLLHQFLSPLSNRRDDEYGGNLDNRLRFPLRVAAAVRDVWPERLPVFVRVSATDWVDGGWDVEQTVQFSRKLRQLGVDLIDVSSGGNVPDAKISVGPNYQVDFAHTIRQQAGIATGAVGLITEPVQAEEIVKREQADLILMGRELLRNPYWPLQAAAELRYEASADGGLQGLAQPGPEGEAPSRLWPPQYVRAKPSY